MTGGGRTDARARALAGLLARSRAMVDDDGPGFPAWSEADGSWRRRVAGEWSSGYPVGMLWLAAGAAALDPAVARRWMLRLGVPTGSRSAFRGFVSYYGAVLGDVLLADCAARDLTVAGARALAEDRHPGAGIVPLDERGARLRPGLVETSIDAVGPTTGLLARAAALTGDGELAALAEHQVRWHLRTLLRDDGSMAQYALLAPEDGRVVDVLTGPQGAGRDSTWARSQGWGPARRRARRALAAARRLPPPARRPGTGERAGLGRLLPAPGAARARRRARPAGRLTLTRRRVSPPAPPRTAGGPGPG